MAAKSMMVRGIGPLVLVVHSSRAPTDADWAAFVQFTLGKLSEGPVQMLVMTEGGGPDARQRAACQVLFEHGPLPVAVVSDVPLVRGMVTAISWFNSGIRAFSFSKRTGLHDALAYLGVDGFMVERVLVEVRAMQRELDARGSR